MSFIFAGFGVNKVFRTQTVEAKFPVFVDVLFNIL